MFRDIIIQKIYKQEFGYRLNFIKIAVISIKKELPVLKYINRGYIVIFYQLNNYAVMTAIHLILVLYCHILLIN